MASRLNVAEYIDRYPFDSDCHWDAERFDFSTLPAIVRRIYFCAANNDGDEIFEEGTRPVNHWMIFLQTGAETSVRLSISSGESSAHPGLIEVSSMKYIVSHFSRKIISSPVPPDISVERIIRLLIDKRRDRYKFTDEHIGCRYWCCCVADDMEKMGWIYSGFTKEVGQAASWYYPDYKNRYETTARPAPIVAGTFFWYEAESCQMDIC